MNNLVDIIVPVYNSSKTIDKCIGSLLNQSYKNINIIIVDDGSTDETLVKCEILKEMDERIQILSKENGGVSSARNKGMDISKADFISFVDSDDFVEIDYIETLIKNLIETNSDISYCMNNDKNASTKNDVLEISSDNYNFFDRFAKNVVWGSIYKRKIICNLRFDESLKIGEDSLFNASAIRNSEKIVITKKGLYNYVLSENSVTKKAFNEGTIDEIKAWEKIIKLFKKEDFRYSCSKAALAKRCQDVIIKNFKYKDFRKSVYKSIKKEFRNNFKYYFCKSSLLHRLSGLLFFLFPLIYSNLRKKK